MNIDIIDPAGVRCSISSTLNERIGDVVSRTLPRTPSNYVYKIRELQLGPKYSKKSFYELGIESGSTIRIEPARGEMVPSTSFDRAIILRGRQTLEARGTFIVGRIWGDRLGIRSFSRDMYIGQLLDESRGNVEQTFSANAENWIQEGCSRYVSRVHAVIYQKGSIFYFLDVSLNGTLLISSGEEKDIRSGRDEFNETGQITPHRLSHSNTVKLFGTSFDIIIKSH
ncbi:MAG: hypothetical protein QW241_08305 [Candidatus Bathyarchaeia archaeon]